MEHVYKFVKDTEYVGPINKTFTHYWNNNSMNFPDTNDFDSGSSECYLKKYYPNYKWVQDDELGINKTNIAYATLTLANWEEPVIFIKFEDDEKNEIPSYYFATNPNSQTVATSNAVHTVYQLELDLWATIGWRFNTWLKEGFNPDILFLRKMCNRFIFNELADRGFWIDFLKQPYLTRSNYSFNLIRDESEKSLTLEEWLWINSGMSYNLSLDYWLESKWFPWLQNQWSAVFDISKTTPTTASSIKLVPGFYQNLDYDSLNNMLNDSAYNSNGKYKWIAIKTGNNTADYDNEGKPITRKGSVFSKNKDVYIEKGPLSIPYLSIENATIEKGEFIRNSNMYTLSYQKEVAYPSDFPVKAIIDFTNELLHKKYIKLNISRKDLVSPDKTLNQSFFIGDKLDKVLRFIEIDSFAKNVEYTLVEFNKKRVFYKDSEVWVDIYPYITLTFKDNAYLIQFKCYIEDYFGGLDYTIDLVEDCVLNKIVVYDKTKQPTTVEQTKIEQFTFNGEEVMYIPIKKGFAGQQYIKWLNNEPNLIFANQNVMGMPINDIPPSVLAMAIRGQANNSEMQNYGDMISTRQAGTNPECPLDVVQLKLSSGVIPVMFNSLNYIPVVMANSPRMNRMYEITGGTNFFNKFYNLLTNEYLSQYNTIYSEPIFLAPQYFQWVYFIDGGHKLSLTPDMIDWYKVVTKSDWTVRLNVNMTDTTHLKLDISDIKYDLYPFTKSQSELISADIITHPYSTEGFNNYIANNQYTQETSKNAKDIQNEWARRNLPIYQAGSIIGGLGSGIASGAAAGGLWGAIAGGIGGLIGGATEAITMKAGLNNKIQMINELWDNQWNGAFSNMYSSPALMNPNGFGSGSLIYSDISKEKNDQLELFRTFQILDLYKRMVWNDISVNGYWFCSQCAYKDYDNRKVFNILNCNFDNVDPQVNDFLKKQIGQYTTLFSQQNFIDWYKLICKNGIRLWKEDFNENSTEDFIRRNIENNYKLPFKPTAQYVKYEEEPLPLDIVVDDNFDDAYWNDRNNYVWELNSGKYRLTKKTPHTESFSIPYSELFGEEVVTPNDFIAKFETMATQYDTSSVEIKTKDSTLAKDVNEALYTLTNIEFKNDVTHYEKDVINQIFNSFPFGTILKAISGAKLAISNKHENGWNVIVDLHNNYLTVQLKEINFFEFTSNEDIRTWHIQKQTSSEKIQIEKPDFKYSPAKYYEKHWKLPEVPEENSYIYSYCTCDCLKEIDLHPSDPRQDVDREFESSNETNATRYHLVSIPLNFFQPGNTIKLNIKTPIYYKLTKDGGAVDISDLTGYGELNRLKKFVSNINESITITLLGKKFVFFNGNLYFTRLYYGSDANGDTIYTSWSKSKHGIVRACSKLRLFAKIINNNVEIYMSIFGFSWNTYGDKLQEISAFSGDEPPPYANTEVKAIPRFDKNEGDLLELSYNVPTEDIAFEEHNKLNSLIFVKREQK